MQKIKILQLNTFKGFQLIWKKIYTLMLRIQTKQELFLNQETSIEEYEVEDKNKLNFKSNIYLGIKCK